MGNQYPKSIRKAAGLLSLFDYRLEHDPRFLGRVASARENLKKDKSIRIENLSD